MTDKTYTHADITAFLVEQQADSIEAFVDLGFDVKLTEILFMTFEGLKAVWDEVEEEDSEELQLRLAERSRAASAEFAERFLR